MGRRLLTCGVDQHGDDVRLTVAGELDQAVAGQLEAVLAEALGRRPHTLTVDVGGVQFIDTHSVGLLVRTCTAARACTVPEFVAQPVSWDFAVRGDDHRCGDSAVVPDDDDQVGRCSRVAGS
jgi:anti-anti-sigma factor